MDNREKFLCYLAFKGLGKIGKADNKEYVDRLCLELKRFISKGYTNYVLANWDWINWAKDKGIRIGAGRGSSGSSLVCFCLNITEIDPVKYDLLFDRLCSVIRKDCLDFDTDVQDDRRDEVFEYLKNKYGAERCAKVITFSRSHSKGIMRDIGRIFNIPKGIVEKVCQKVIQRSLGDARCIAGDMLVQCRRTKRTIRNICEKSWKKASVWSYNFKNKEFEFVPVRDRFINGKQKVFEVKLENGRKIRCTENHRFYTNNGWKKLKNMTTNDEIAVQACKACGKETNSGSYCNSKCTLDYRNKFNNPMWNRKTRDKMIKTSKDARYGMMV